LGHDPTELWQYVPARSHLRFMPDQMSGQCEAVATVLRRNLGRLLGRFDNQFDESVGFGRRIAAARLSEPHALSHRFDSRRDT